MVGGVSKAQHCKLDPLQGVWWEGLPQEEPPRLLHVVWLISLPSGGTYKYHHRHIEEIGLNTTTKTKKQEFIFVVHYSIGEYYNYDSSMKILILHSSHNTNLLSRTHFSY